VSPLHDAEVGRPLRTDMTPSAFGAFSGLACEDQDQRQRG
jgi:hypothetical protein